MTPDQDIDKKLMRRCIELAIQAMRSGNTPVGCVIAEADNVLAEAAERCPASGEPFGHAEVLAVEALLRAHKSPKLGGATLYTTNEPCFLCSYAIREAGIGRVVFAIETPEIGGATSAYPILTAHDIQRWSAVPAIEPGLLAAEFLARRASGC